VVWYGLQQLFILRFYFFFAPFELVGCPFWLNIQGMCEARCLSVKHMKVSSNLLFHSYHWPSSTLTSNWHINKICLVHRGKSVLKGTVSRDFLLLVFFMNQFPPSPRVSHYDEKSQGAPQVSKTPAANFATISLVLLILAANLPAVSMTPVTNNWNLKVNLKAKMYL
jgi:hypothetical protein